MAYHVVVDFSEGQSGGTSRTPNRQVLEAFRSPVIDRIMAGPTPGIWKLPSGTLELPRVFGFCRGVKRALAIADRATVEHAAAKVSGRLVLLGEIIHNPWVNDYFRQRGVCILTMRQRGLEQLDHHVDPQDSAVIPAFGVPLPIERRLGRIGCKVIDCSCGDVRRLWRWGAQAVRDGFGVMIFGRVRHDETVVTKTRLAETGGKYIVLEDLDQVETFGRMLSGDSSPEEFRERFDADKTNAEDIGPLLRLAQVSQTTMLYDHTLEAREALRRSFVERFGQGDARKRLRFQPTVCKATQDRQNAAVELCRSGRDVVVVVGGFDSSNTRHLYELASRYAPAYLTENAEAIRSAEELLAWDLHGDDAKVFRDWLPKKRPLRIGVLAGASSPEIVVGQVLQRLAQFLQ